MLYTIGEMAKVIGVPASTLRYYDQKGLLPFVERSSGGIRMFTEKDYEWLKVIECLKKSGLSINEIKAFTDMAERGDDSLSERLELFQSRREAVIKQIEEMKEALELLEFKCWYYTQAVQDGTEEKVRSLSADELPDKYRELRQNMRHLSSAQSPDSRETY